jgi:hypothetical protein
MSRYVGGDTESSGSDHWNNAHYALHQTLNEDELRGCPLLVFANKQVVVRKCVDDEVICLRANRTFQMHYLPRKSPVLWICLVSRAEVRARYIANFASGPQVCISHSHCLSPTSRAEM